MRPKTEPEIAARVPPHDRARSIRGLLEQRIVLQRRVQELARFVVGKGIAIEIVRGIELPTKEVEAIVDKPQSKPDFPRRQLFVLPPQRLRIRVHAGQTPESLIGPWASDGLKIDEQRRPRHRPGEKRDIE